MPDDDDDDDDISSNSSNHLQDLKDKSTYDYHNHKVRVMPMYHLNLEKRDEKRINIIGGWNHNLIRLYKNIYRNSLKNKRYLNFDIYNKS